MINVYGNEKFAPEEAKKHVEMLINSFRKYYSELGYTEKSPILASSGVDPTVRFIGSHISVFKPYLITGYVPPPGIYMQQDCVRTRNVKHLFEDDYYPTWGSYFPSIGVLSSPERLNEACKDISDFLRKELKISSENILIRANSFDDDLMCACNHCCESTEINSRQPEYYRHKMGIEGIWGRNCNIALKNSIGNGFSDIGNIIVIEREAEKIGIEIALGSTVILKQLYGLDHVQDCIPVPGLDLRNETIRRKFEDSIITSTVLFREGLKPFERNSRSRILKQYVLSLSYFRAKSGLSISEVFKIISNFEKREFPGSIQHVSGIIIKAIEKLEKDVLLKKNPTETEMKIKTALKYI
jgi:hypothetical protein